MPRSLSVALAIAIASIFTHAAGFAQDPRPAAEILREFRSVHMPGMSRGTDAESGERFKRAIEEGCARQAALALEMYRGHPDHTEVPQMLSTRWAGMTNALGQAAEVLAEVGELLEVEEREPICAQAVLAAARAGLVLDVVSRADKLALIEAAIGILPEDERGPHMLTEIARYHTADPSEMRQLAERVMEGWRDSRWAAPAARGILKLLDRVGQPLQLSFDDVLGSGRIDSTELGARPFVVVVWSGSWETLREEIAAVGELRRERPQLRVLGVYCWRFEGGREPLGEALRAQSVTWPTAYPEEDFAEPWSGRWGHGEVPYYLLVEGGRVTAVGHRVRVVTSLLQEPSREL